MRNIAEKLIDRMLSVRLRPSWPEMALTKENIREQRSANPGPVEQAFFANSGRVAHKWIHYLPIYDRVLAPYHNKPVRMLEIGVSQGGSLGLWRSYFGADATIFGIDVDPACADRCDPPNQVRIGSQADPAFLRSVVSEMGGLDIVLDDGSHVAPHQATSFDTLFPLVETGGLYIVEDTHTSYWPSYDGGYRRPGTAIELAKTLIDDQHAWYHGRPQVLAARNEIGAVLVFDSIVVIEKVDRPRPGHYKTGSLAVV